MVCFTFYLSCARPVRVRCVSRMIGVGVEGRKVAASTRPATWRLATPVRWWVSACVAVRLRACLNGGVATPGTAWASRWRSASGRERFLVDACPHWGGAAGGRSLYTSVYQTVRHVWAGSCTTLRAKMSDEAP